MAAARSVPGVDEVRVLNHEINTHYYLYVRHDRIAQFYESIVGNRRSGLPAKYTGQGISGAAALGLSAIFTHIPSKFPIEDILLFLRDEQKTYLGSYLNPTITVQEIEAALEDFACHNSQLVADGSEIQ